MKVVYAHIASVNVFADFMRHANSIIDDDVELFALYEDWLEVHERACGEYMTDLLLAHAAQAHIAHLS